MAFFDFFGFGSKRRTALRGFDAALAGGEVNPAYVDDGMRFLIYKWATDEETTLGVDAGHVDRRMVEAARMLSYCVLGPGETERVFGAAARAAGDDAVAAAVKEEGSDSFTARVIKLALARGITAPDIAAQIEVEDPN